MNQSWVKGFIITTFVSLYLVVSIISTIHVIDFFRLSNPNWLAVSLAIAFELGAAASLASLIALEKMNKLLIWFLFILLTCMQMMGNTYYAFTHLNDYQGWVDLFGLNEEDVLYQKRFLSIISGAILPIVALGFIKSLVDYIRPSEAAPLKEEEKESVSDENIAPETEEDLPQSESVPTEETVDKPEEDQKSNDIVFDGGGSFFGSPPPVQPEIESPDESQTEEVSEPLQDPGGITFIEKSPAPKTPLQNQNSHQSVYIDPLKIM
jgi:hypothetical protein